MAILVTFLLGPIGLLFYRVGPALALILLAIVTAGTGIGPIICWIIAMLFVIGITIGGGK